MTNACMPRSQIAQTVLVASAIIMFFFMLGFSVEYYFDRRAKIEATLTPSHFDVSEYTTTPEGDVVVVVPNAKKGDFRISLSADKKSAVRYVHDAKTGALSWVETDSWVKPDPKTYNYTDLTRIVMHVHDNDRVLR